MYVNASILDVLKCIRPLEKKIGFQILSLEDFKILIPLNNFEIKILGGKQVGGVYGQYKLLFLLRLPKFEVQRWTQMTTC